jgi:hypothetical protein
LNTQQIHTRGLQVQIQGFLSTFELRKNICVDVRRLRRTKWADKQLSVWSISATASRTSTRGDTDPQRSTPGQHYLFGLPSETSSIVMADNESTRRMSRLGGTRVIYSVHNVVQQAKLRSQRFKPVVPNSKWKMGDPRNGTSAIGKFRDKCGMVVNSFITQFACKFLN